MSEILIPLCEHGEANLKCSRCQARLETMFPGTHFDWESVDWEKTPPCKVVDISGCSRSTEVKWRRKLAPETVGKFVTPGRGGYKGEARRKRRKVLDREIQIIGDDFE